MLNTVLFLIFWAAYIIPIAIPLLWLVFTIVTHSRQAKPAYVNNKDGKASLSVLHGTQMRHIYAHKPSDCPVRSPEAMGPQEKLWALSSRKICATSSAGGAQPQAVRAAA